MNYLIDSKEFHNILCDVEEKLLQGVKLKYARGMEWRKTNIPAFPGLYALFDKDQLLYIGETGNLRERMNDVFRTVNHTFRYKLARQRFGVTKAQRKFDSSIETLLDAFFDNDLRISFVEANFGRVELETGLVTKYQTELLNSVKKRKLKQTLDQSPH